ncbi:MAG TPA: LacI family DNA-binding transcriptional regulator [Candidatus Didemnitutus sp.]|nr:LacI family DNA-binding transcriptional regulator [Candidatus Didemnitutus sp.]
MSASAPTLRTLARELGLSRTTVSDALRGSLRVKAVTVQRVRAAAKAAGYERNPLTGAVMSQLRRSRGQQFRGVLAALEVVDPNSSELTARYNQTLVQGISQRANNLGFKIERFEVGAQAVRLNRLDTILHTRGIQGLILLPASGFPDLSGLNWERYTAVYADYFIDQPPLHCVCSDHYRSMVGLLQELHRRGYRRPGLFMEIPLDERLQFRWEGAFLALQKYLPGITEVPPLRVPTITQAGFEAWFRQHDPDVVLGHFPAAATWMKNCGARLPKTHSFVCLNTLRTAGECAALDLQTAELGARAAELVIGQLLHNEFGIPSQPSLTTIPARLIEGPTLRPPGAAGAKKRRG